ncbi:DUF4230 domain-containing protein [Dyadobacter fermentans]|uniref:DUF4230 domain-containing protein n=1 Tax=Dyadobacter fermentans (strain ATCC 700827 / DSM 18053 / CIP 107007 / KCTC 52180 / NS114) TaxID=471854 RepID=C6W5B8_DYAFD|nr:DUF4230 domain-containing protein [Dyadobacter fermentans]ACT94136.1 conserved hypothetical protein [Dyadobacter fermentans DSM 18053]
MDSSTLFFLIIALIAGGLSGAALNTWLQARKSKKYVSTQEASVLIERIEKVFKVVMAEGYFTEIYNYQNDKNIWNLINDKKKALIIAKAKVLVGYDFGKMKFHRPDGERKLVIDFFPAPEILSIDTDYKFYDIEQGWLNRFQSDDYTAILNEAKQTMNEKAMESDLPRIAGNQVQLMIFQLAASMNWSIEMKLPDGNVALLREFSHYRTLEAEIDSLDGRKE